MSEPKFTKGNLFARAKKGIRFSDEGCPLSLDRKGVSYVSAGVYDEAVRIDYNGNDLQLFANVHLVSAAPEMYEMLKDFLDNYELGSGTDKEIENLLAKARGE